MDHRPPYSSVAYTDVARSAFAPVRAHNLSLWQIVPRHRIPVIAKTPLLALVGVYIANGNVVSREVWMTLGLTAFLWAILYALNEATDLNGEQHIEVDRRIRLWLPAGCALVCVLGSVIAVRLGVLLALMTVGQSAYCMPPFRLKRYWWAGPLLSGLLNPVLRLECGAIWGTRSIPLPVYAVFISLHLGAAILSRCLLRKRDARLGYHTAPANIEWLGGACTIFGLLGAYVLCWAGILPRFCLLFATLGVGFSIYAWSGRVTSLSRLRRGWMLFALMALLTLAALLIHNLFVGAPIYQHKLPENRLEHRRAAPPATRAE